MIMVNDTTTQDTLENEQGIEGCCSVVGHSRAA